MSLLKTWLWKDHKGTCLFMSMAFPLNIRPYKVNKSYLVGTVSRCISDQPLTFSNEFTLFFTQSTLLQKSLWICFDLNASTFLLYGLMLQYCTSGFVPIVLSSLSMSLWEVADFLKGQGVINAINLDGGGSSTYVANGSLASYPSDRW